MCIEKEAVDKMIAHFVTAPLLLLLSFLYLCSFGNNMYLCHFTPFYMICLEVFYFCAYFPIYSLPIIFLHFTYYKNIMQLAKAFIKK